MQIPRELETTSLQLRALILEDAPLMFEAYAKDPEVARYMAWKLTGNYDDTLQFVKSAVQKWVRHDQSSEDFAYAICLKGSGEFIGCCSVGPHSPTISYHWGMGYNLARKHWGQGYATEAVRALSQMAIALPEVFRVSAVVDIENIGSARVLEKAGFSREGTLRRYAIHPNVSTEPRDIFIYSLVK